MNNVVDILWSPIRSDYFLLAGQGLSLYKVSNTQDGDSGNATPGSLVGSNKTAHFIGSNPSYSNVRSSAWCYEKAVNLVAVGLSSGRTSILAFNSSVTVGSSMPASFEVQELVPRHLRSVNCVAWNAVEPNFLLTTFDKYRSDASILVWDINLAPWIQYRRQMSNMAGAVDAYGTAGKKISVTSTAGSDSQALQQQQLFNALQSERARFLDPTALPMHSGSSNTSVNNNVPVSSRPIYEYGQSETVTSSCWFPTQSRTILAGFQNRGLRIIDLREPQRAMRTGPTTKMIRGLCIDRAQENRVAGFIDSSCAIWDLRNAERSLAELTFKRPVAKIEWCPARPGLLAVACRDASEIRLVDVQHSFVSQQECEPYVLERDLGTHEKRPIVSFSWSPYEMALLTTSNSGAIFYLDVQDRLTLASAAVSNDVLCVSGNQIGHLSTFRGAEPVVDLNFSTDNNKQQRVVGQNATADVNSAAYYYDSIDERSLDSFSRNRLNLPNNNNNIVTAEQKVHATHDSNRQPDLLNILSTRARFGYGCAPLELLSNNVTALENACIVSTGSHIHNYLHAMPECSRQLPQLWKWMQMIYQMYYEKSVATGGTSGAVHDFSNFTGILSWLSTSATTAQAAQQQQQQSWTQYSATVRQMPKTSTGQQQQQPASDCRYGAWSDSRITTPVRHYSSRERSRITDLCGWTSQGVHAHVLELVDSLAEDGQFERAACIALLNLYIQKALSILQQASTTTTTLPQIKKQHAKNNLEHATVRSGEDRQNLAIVAMALAGFTDEHNTLWRDLARTTGQKISSPYLKTMFAFLYELPNEKYDAILYDNRLMLNDRIAFAALYLPDAVLLQYLTRIAVAYVRDTNLEAMPLVGFSRAGIMLVQRYVNKTGDIQTAAALACLAGTDAWRISAFTINWIESYRSLLDGLRLWHIRAAFDVAKKKLATMRLAAAGHHGSTDGSKAGAAASLHTRQIFASCSFCGKPVVHASSVNSASSTATTSLTRLQGDKIQRVAVRAGPISSTSGAATGGGSNTAVVATPSLTGRAWANSNGTTCPSCGKPLPRCTLCELHLGTPPSSAGSLEATDADLQKSIDSQKLRKTAPIGLWFLWCQTCRHGGHTDHMLEWFDKYSECPVTGCTCRCASMDGGVGDGALSLSSPSARPSLEFDTTFLQGVGGGDNNYNYENDPTRRRIDVDGAHQKRPPASFTLPPDSNVVSSGEQNQHTGSMHATGSVVVSPSKPAGVDENNIGARERSVAQQQQQRRNVVPALNEEAPFLCGASTIPPTLAQNNAATRHGVMVRR